MPDETDPILPPLRVTADCGRQRLRGRNTHKVPSVRRDNHFLSSAIRGRSGSNEQDETVEQAETLGKTAVVEMVGLKVGRKRSQESRDAG